jgi:hypothetical protein
VGVARSEFAGSGSHPRVTVALRWYPLSYRDIEVTADRAAVYPRVLDKLLPTAQHITDRFASSRVEADHGRLNARLRPMRGLKKDRSARTIAVGHAFVQNVRRAHYELAADAPMRHPRGCRIRRTHPRDLINRPPWPAYACPRSQTTQRCPW